MTFVYDLESVDGFEHHSDVIHAVFYNSETKELAVVAYGAGRATSRGYVYSDVEESTYNVFVNSSSLGRFWSNNIQGNFTATRHDDFEAEERDHNTEDTSVVSDVESDTTEPDDAAYSRFAVRWEYDNGHIGGAPQYQAVNVEDAIRQFTQSIEAARSLGLLAKPHKVTAVTQYFD